MSGIKMYTSFKYKNLFTGPDFAFFCVHGVFLSKKEIDIRFARVLLEILH